MASETSPEDDFVYRLQLPTESTLKAFGYFVPEVWPVIAAIIQNYLKNRKLFHTVAPMIEEDDNGLKHPWILVRAIPQDPDTDMKNLAEDVEQLLLQSGFSNSIYRVHVQDAKRGHRPAPIDTDFKEQDYRQLPADLAYTHPDMNAIPTPRRLSVTGELPDIADPKIVAAIRASKKTSESKRSVKHLTCWYWHKHPSGCIKDDKDCLYAHWDTGRYADKPRIVIPGGPRLAGRTAHRLQDALRQTYKGYDSKEYAGIGSAALGRKGKERAVISTNHFSGIDYNGIVGKALRGEFAQSGGSFQENADTSSSKNGSQRIGDGSQTVEDLVVTGPSHSAPSSFNRGKDSLAEYSDDSSDDDNDVKDETQKNDATPGPPRSDFGTHGRENKRKHRRIASISEPTGFETDQAVAKSGNVSTSNAQNDNPSKDRPLEANSNTQKGKRAHQKQKLSLTGGVDLTGILDIERTVNDTRHQLRRANTQLVLGAREFNVGFDMVIPDLEQLAFTMDRMRDLITKVLGRSTDENLGLETLVLTRQGLRRTIDATNDAIAHLRFCHDRGNKAMENDYHYDSIFHWFHHTNTKYDAPQTIAGAKHIREYLAERGETAVSNSKSDAAKPGNAKDSKSNLASPGNAKDTKEKEVTTYERNSTSTSLFAVKTATVPGPSATSRRRITPTIVVTPASDSKKSNESKSDKQAKTRISVNDNADTSADNNPDSSKNNTESNKDKSSNHENNSSDQENKPDASAKAGTDSNEEADSDGGVDIIV